MIDVQLFVPKNITIINKAKNYLNDFKNEIVKYAKHNYIKPCLIKNEQHYLFRSDNAVFVLILKEDLVYIKEVTPDDADNYEVSDLIFKMIDIKKINTNTSHTYYDYLKEIQLEETVIKLYSDGYKKEDIIKKIDKYF